MFRSQITVLALTLGLSATAFGQATRTWVSGTGADSNPCTRTLPCATFAAAYAVTAAGGEIDALDPGSFGQLTIDHTITIDGGTSTSTSEIVAASGNGLDVRPPQGSTVTLRNLNILGMGTGDTGIAVTDGTSVRVQRVRVTGFKGDGLSFSMPNTGIITVDDSVSNDNGGNGLYVTSASDVAGVGITGSYFSGNTNGIYANSGSKVTVNDSQAIGNSVGFFSQSSSKTLASMTLYRCNSSSNAVAGFKAGDGGFAAVIRLSKVTTQFNGTDLVGGGNGHVFSFGDNSISGAGAPEAVLPLR